MKTRYYLTKNGNILNVEKGCFQDADGNFLRRVLAPEMEYLVGVLTPVEFPDGLPQPDVPVWEYMWSVVESDDADDYSSYHFFTRLINFKREYFYLHDTHKYCMREFLVKVIDTDDDEMYLYDEDNEDFNAVCELTYADGWSGGFTTLSSIMEFDNPDPEEKLLREQLLQSNGISFPERKGRARKKQTLNQ